MNSMLTTDDASRVIHEVQRWKDETNYVITPDDTAVMRGVAVGSLRRLIYKVAMGTAIGVLVGVTLPRFVRTFTVPFSVTSSAGMLGGIYMDSRTRQVEFLKHWLQLQRSTTTPLAEKLFSTVVEVSPNTDAGRISKAWLDSHNLSPSSSPFPSSSPYPSPSYPSPNPSTPNYQPHPSSPIPASPGTRPSPTARGPGSGFYDVTGTVPKTGGMGAGSGDLPHRSGTGFYDVSKQGYTPTHEPPPSRHRHSPKRASDDVDQETEPIAEATEKTSPPPTLRSVFVRPPPVPAPPTHPTLPFTRYSQPKDSSDSQDASRRKNRYGDEVIIA